MESPVRNKMTRLDADGENEDEHEADGVDDGQQSLGDNISGLF